MNKSIKPGLKAVLLDLDGVLVNSYPAWFHLLNAGTKLFGYPPATEEAFASSWGQSVEDDIERFLPGLSPQTLSRFFEDNFFDYIKYVCPNPEAKEVLKSLHDSGIKTAVITNTPTKLATDILRNCSLSVDLVVGSGDVEKDKPAPDMVIYACKTLGVINDEAVVVGDSDFDRQAAIAAGLVFVGYETYGDFRIEELSELPELLNKQYHFR